MSNTVVHCHFEDGKMPCAFMPTALDSRSHSTLKFKRTADDANNSSTTLASVHPQNTKIRVEGTRFNPNSSRYAIGILQEGSSDLFLYEAEAFSVQALVDGIVVHNHDGPIVDGKTNSYLDKKKELINTYAPVKKQRQLRAAVNSYVSDEKIEGYEESMETMKKTLQAAETLDEKKISLEQQTGIIGQMRDLLPPFDLEATAPGGIYDFSVLFPENLLAGIDPTDTESTCHVLLKWIHDDFRPVLSSEDDIFAEMKSMKTLIQLGRLYFAAKQEKRKSFAKLLNILVSMIYLYKNKRKKNWEAYDIYANQLLAQRLGELYSPDKQAGGLIDREGANKLLAHIALFILRLTPYWEFDFSDVKTDLNIQSKDLLAILAFCGIKIKQTSGRSTTSLVGSLKAPLVVQTSFSAGGKGRGKGAAPKKK
jgi:hypothetical protein